MPIYIPKPPPLPVPKSDTSKDKFDKKYKVPISITIRTNITKSEKVDKSDSELRFS